MSNNMDNMSINERIASLTEEIEKVKNRLEQAGKLLADLQREQQESKKQRESKKQMEVGDEYFYIMSEGVVSLSVWDNYDVDFFRAEIGNVFWSAKETEFAVERLKVLTQMRKYACKPKPGNLNWSLSANTNGQIAITFSTGIHSDVVFATEADAKACVEEIGKERLRKYYFGLDDDE